MSVLDTDLVQTFFALCIATSGFLLIYMGSNGKPFNRYTREGLIGGGSILITLGILALARTYLGLSANYVRVVLGTLSFFFVITIGEAAWLSRCYNNSRYTCKKR